jgi:hypothetical protein
MSCMLHSELLLGANMWAVWSIRHGRESHRVGYPKLRLLAMNTVHTQKCYRTGSSLQSSSDQLKNFLGRHSPVFIVLGDWLPRLTVTWFRRLTSHNDILLLCRRPMLALEFEPPTPPITKVWARTHSALELLACLLDPPVCPIQPGNGTDHEWVSLTFPEHVYTACLALGPGL